MSQDKWRNAGAPFTLSSGVRVGRGDVFSAPEQSRDVVMRRLKLEPAPPDAEVTVGLPDTEDVDAPEVRFPGVPFGSRRAYELARDAWPAVGTEELRQVEGSGAFDAEAGRLSLLAGDVRDYLRVRERRRVERGREEAR